MDDAIDITILCLSYNHARYLEQCLEGIFSQKVEANIEIVIHDDASTDGSRQIIERYAGSHPKIVRSAYQLENQFSRGVNPLAAALPFLRGRYVAVCEGDDIWTDEGKLQAQYDCLEADPTRKFVGAQCESFDESGRISAPFPALRGGERGAFTLGSDDIMSMQDYIHTSTFFLRRTLLEYWSSTFPLHVKNGDLCVLVCALVQDAGLLVIGRVVSRYRIHAQGIWSSTALRQRYLDYSLTWNAITPVLEQEGRPALHRSAYDNLAFFSYLAAPSLTRKFAAIQKWGLIPIGRAVLARACRRASWN